jgi:hypothetical protein
MPSDKPWLDGPTPEDRAREKVWQGSMLCGIGVVSTATTYFGFGFIWFWTVIAAVCGLFWLLTGLVTLFTGYE